MLSAAAQHLQLRLLVLRGAGRSFSAGADLEWMRAAQGWSEQENAADALGLAGMLRQLAEFPAFTLALVQGAAFGGGAGLVSACDAAIAVRDTRFCFSEVKLGLTPATISPYVVAAIGPRAARELFMTAAVFNAEEAQQLGLVKALVDDTAALDQALVRYQRLLGQGAPGAIADAKQLVSDVAGCAYSNALDETTAARIAARRVSAEGREGLAAFLEKRSASWLATEEPTDS